MYKENVLIINGVVVSNDTVSFAHSPIYEVIRIHKSYPSFLMEHMDRLKASAELAGIRGNIDFKKIASSVKSIVYSAEIEENNIRIEVGNLQDGSVCYKVYPIPSIYPSDYVYKVGVETETLEYERSNPVAKIKREQYTTQMQQEILKRGVYEVVLTSHEGYVLEGSKSNIFFLKGRELITPKADNVLGGITRMMVLEQAKLIDDLFVAERDISIKELSGFDAAFLTGTSPGVLPIKRIDDIKYCSANNQIVKKIRTMYQQIL